MPALDAGIHAFLRPAMTIQVVSAAISEVL
jgi:hypothetical protein